jgi:hypothetical protein
LSSPPSLRGCLLGVLAATIVAPTSAETSAVTKSGEYKNVDYAYTVSLPKKLHYEMSKAPNPNHGFSIKITPSATVWVDSSYTDEPTLNQAADSERAMWEEGNCRTKSTEAGELDGASAVQLSLNCAGESKGASPTTVTVIMALASPPNRGRIRYEIGMQYPSGAVSKVRTQQVFRTVEAGFRFLHPSD